jgi:Domain of unknown function (DUF1840)
MLVKFRSTATESITMFGDSALSLLKLMGASGKVPGALNADDLPIALRELEGELEKLKVLAHAPTPAPPAMNEDTAASEDEEDEDDASKEQPIALATRAVPLISMMKRAAAAHRELMWEQA